jgi:hypothetical protein
MKLFKHPLSAATCAAVFLIVFRDAGVANEHCAKVSPLLYIKQYLFATHKAPEMGDMAFRC